MPLLGPTMEGRNQAFQLLKPACVALSQEALALNGTHGNIQKTTARLEELKATLSAVTTLDAKLADYVFFPLSQLLKHSQKLSIRCLELSLQCIGILVKQGWRSSMQPQLAAQLVILCTLVAEKKPKGFTFAGNETTDELQTAAFRCLNSVFDAAGGSVECKELFRSEAQFPQLGQTISVILDGVENAIAVETQVAAVSSLEALVEHIADRELCASFLPGIVSKLTKILTPSTKQRRNYQVLIACLCVLHALLQRTLGDDADVVKVKGQQQTNTIIDAAWVENAATQLQPALTSVMTLRSHSRDDVKDALAKFCLMLLEHCRKSLANSSSMALETLITLSTNKTSHGAQFQLELLIKADPSISSLIQNTTYDWLQSLPTVMQSADEQAKTQRLQQVSTAYGLLIDSGADAGVIDRMLAGSLRDSVVITMQAPEAKRETLSLVSPVQSLELAVLDGGKGSTDFESPLVRYRGQEEIMAGIERFAETINSSAASNAFATDLTRSLRSSQGEVQIANFWLLLTATQTALQRKDAISDFVDIGESDSSLFTDYLEEMYSFSLSVLTNTSSEEPPDPRLQSLALRALALRAKLAGEDFRYEMIDALYPVLHILATPDPRLQRDSITTLNIFTASCGYPSVKDLIVENVDYLTNAVALKLNAFDVSPQAPQVLLMMVRLAGAGLLPYLEDTVESIFAALEDYHGYPVLVELLFRVLGVMAEEGAKAPQLAIADAGGGTKAGWLRERWRPISVDALAEMLREKADEEVEEMVAAEERDAHPQRPWKEDDKDKNEQGSRDDETLAHDDQGPDDVDLPPPAPKTYNLLFKITELTQHFLPSASPSLRTSLLSLVKTTVPAIARHENSFLPLINTLWPEIVTRLDDTEPHVQASALEVVGILCEYAGDFMRTRIVDLWPGIVDLHQRIAGDILASEGYSKAAPTQKKGQNGTELIAANLTRAVGRMYGSPANTSARMMWEALVATLMRTARSMELPPEMFDDVLKMLEPVLGKHEVAEALEEVNADAVWLARVRVGLVEMPVMPNGE